MRRILSILLIFLFIGCATDSAMLVRLNKLESELQEIKGPTSVGPVISKKRLQELAESGEAVKIRGFNCTVGGVSGCLDNYPTANLAAGDLAMVFNDSTNVITFHIFDDADDNPPADPEYVAPVDRGGTELWKLFNGFRYLPSTTSSVNFRDHDNANIQAIIAKIGSNSTNEANGTEDGDLTFSVIGAGELRDYMVLDGDSGIKILYSSDTDWIEDDTYTGIVLSDYDAGENINQWSMVYFDESDNEWMLADADEVSGGKNWPARGMAVDCPNGWPCQNGEDMYVLVHGKVKNVGWSLDQWGEDGALYLSTTAGGFLDKDAAATSLVATGDCVQVVGWAISSDTIMIAPSLNWLEVE